MTHEILKSRWGNLFQYKAEEDYIHRGFRDLAQRYSESHRAYHTLEHVYACLNAFDTIKEKLSEPLCIEVAIWFHDVIYKPIKNNNEQQSAAYARNFLEKTEISKDATAKIENLICLTKHPAKPYSEDEKYLLDIDLLILGAEKILYDKYECWIRKEYSFVPDFLYKRGRKKLLKTFLDSPNIFQTAYFKSKFEHQARVNIKRTLCNG